MNDNQYVPGTGKKITFLAGLLSDPATYSYEMCKEYLETRRGIKPKHFTYNPKEDKGCWVCEIEYWD